MVCLDKKKCRIFFLFCTILSSDNKNETLSRRELIQRWCDEDHHDFCTETDKTECKKSNGVWLRNCGCDNCSTQPMHIIQGTLRIEETVINNAATAKHLFYTTPKKLRMVWLWSSPTTEGKEIKLELVSICFLFWIEVVFLLQRRSAGIG